MLQPAEILQMNAQELTEFIKELSMENPIVEMEEDMPEDKAGERIQKRSEERRVGKECG